MRSSGLIWCGISAALVACSDAEPTPDGGGSDAAVSVDAPGADAAPRADAAPGADAPGGGPDADVVVPDPSLRGTRFERVGIRWSGALELCTAFRGRDPAVARASRLHVTLAPSPRSGLGREALGRSTLSGGTLRRSPFGADHARIEAVTSTLADWSLTDPTGNARLSARLVHRVAGGELVEELSAGRDGTSDAAVEVDALIEVAFSFVDTSTPASPRTIALEPCGVGSATRETGYEVLVAEGERGQTLAVLREVRSNRVVAGSAPVTLVRAAVALTGADPWLEWRAEGFWTWTYAASLHNWNERSTLDFTQDLGLWHSVFRPGAPLAFPEAPIARLDFVGVNGPGVSGDVEVVRRDLRTGVEARSTWRALTQWRGVGADTLVPSCAGGSVDTVQLGPSSIFHVVRCAGDVIEAVMPVLFSYDHRRNGDRLEGRELTPARLMDRPAVRVTFAGRSAVVLAAWDATTYLGEISDETGTTVYSGLAPAASPLLWSRGDEELLRASADGQVRLRIARRYAWQGVGESAIYAPVRVTVEHAGGRYEAEAYDRITYTNTHHNWNDDLVARTDAHEIRWDVEYNIGGGGLTERVRVTRLSDGAVVVPDVVVVP